MAPPAPLHALENGPPTRVRLFLIGMLGLLLAISLTGAVEGCLRILGGHGSAPKLYFVAAAVLTPVLALALLVALVTAMTGRTRLLLREVKRFEEEMSAHPPELNEEAHGGRELTTEAARRFVHVVAPLVTGLAVQVLATEAFAIYCVVAGVEDRIAAIALGAEMISLFAYLLFFNAMLARLTGARGASPRDGSQERLSRSRKAQ